LIHLQKKRTQLDKPKRPKQPEENEAE